MKFRRTVRFRVSGPGIPAFMSAVKKSPAVCTAQKCSRGEYSGQIYFSDIGIIESIAEKTGISLVIEPQDCCMYRVFRYRTRYGIAAGILFTALFIFFMSAFVMQIEVNGCSSINEDEILSVLSECGISHGKFIPAIDFSSAEYKLESRVSRIAWSAIRNRGGRVIVDISEDDGRSGSVHSEIPCNIVSDRDARIISVRTFRGQCAIKEGDAVSEGDLLISGILTNDKNNYVSAHADGEITAEYKEEQDFARCFENTEKVYSGTVYRKVIDFFGFRIPCGISPAKNRTADRSEHTDWFEISGHELPAGIVTEKYDIYETENITETEEQACRDIELQIMMYEKNFLSDKKIKDRKLGKSVFEDHVEYHAEYIVEGSIGKEKMIFPAKTEKITE